MQKYILSLKYFSSFIKYNYKDPFNFQSLLNQQQISIRNAAKKFANQFLLPRVIHDYQNQYCNHELMKKFGQQGFLGSTIKQFDLPGISYISYGLINYQLQKIDSAYRSAISVQSGLVIFPIYQFGNQQLKKKYIPKLANGDLIGCFGLTQPNSGSDPSSLKTKAIKDGDYYIISGSKTWITNSPIADIFIIWAKNQQNKIVGFVLQKGMKGLSANIIKHKLSLCASITGDISMDQVRVHKKNKLQVTGLRGPLSCLNNARFGISWGTLGSAQFCFQTARDYVLSRKQFDAPLAAFQLPQKKLAQMQTQISLGLLGCYHLSKIMDQDKISPELISMLKLNNCIKSLNIARNARDMLGGNGISGEYHIMRHLINLQTVNTYQGTQDIHTLILGRAITGIQAFTRNYKEKNIV